ncbi:MAG: hypothetical protein IJY47_02435 [Clostridia bacterium]|nr:hypothetical protein [Clostridia bacterium]
MIQCGGTYGCGGIGSLENERALWAMQRVRQGDKTRRVATFRERIDYVLSRIAGAAARKKLNMRVWRNWQTRKI